MPDKSAMTRELILAVLNNIDFESRSAKIAQIGTLGLTSWVNS